MKFITVNLLQVAPEARAKFDEYKDLLQAFASGEKGYPEFAGRVLRRSRGENEDGPAQEDSGPHWFDDPPDV